MILGAMDLRFFRVIATDKFATHFITRAIYVDHGHIIFNSSLQKIPEMAELVLTMSVMV